MLNKMYSDRRQQHPVEVQQEEPVMPTAPIVPIKPLQTPAFKEQIVYKEPKPDDKDERIMKLEITVLDQQKDINNLYSLIG